MEEIKTPIKISEEVLKNTTKCIKDFSCLRKDREDLCKIESCIENKIYFIKCLSDEPCQYKATFGYSLVCTCPTRKELYNLYKM